MKAYKCDRCGKLFEKYKYQGTSEFFSITHNPCISGSCLDLCPNCNAELQEWVANDKKQEICIEADKESEDGRRMTKEKFLYGLNACAVTYHNDQKFYEHDDLVKCFEDLGMFGQEPKTDVFDKIRAEIEKKIVKRPWLDFEDGERDRNDAFLEVLDIIDKYKAGSEE